MAATNCSGVYALVYIRMSTSAEKNIHSVFLDSSIAYAYCCCAKFSSTFIIPDILPRTFEFVACIFGPIVISDSPLRAPINNLVWFGLFS
jgi:hypothetical protein